MNDRDLRVIKAVNILIDKHVFKTPIDVARICQVYNFKLIPASEYIAKGIDRKELFEMWGNPDGVSISRGDKHVINYNDAVPLNRMRFTLAEEMFHIILGHTQDDRFNVFNQTYSEELYQQYEAEAKHGAAMLLLPPSVYFRLNPLQNGTVIARECKISVACFKTAQRYYEENRQDLREHFSRRFIRTSLDGKTMPEYNAISIWA